jgi:hypothetical protein
VNPPTAAITAQGHRPVVAPARLKRWPQSPELTFPRQSGSCQKFQLPEGRCSDQISPQVRARPRTAGGNGFLGSRVYLYPRSGYGASVARRKRMTTAARVAARAVAIIQVPTGGVLVGTRCSQPPLRSDSHHRGTVLRQRSFDNGFDLASLATGVPVAHGLGDTSISMSPTRSTSSLHLGAGRHSPVQVVLELRAGPCE